MNDDTKIILLNRRNNPPLECLVDASNYEWLLSIGNWHLHNPSAGITAQYASCKRADPTLASGAKSVLMHRVILGALNGQIADHINGNGLDNRRSNLRFATPFESACNRRRINPLGFRGISLRFGRYAVRINAKNKAYDLGTYDTPEEAARVYDAKALELHGDFAVLNFPTEIKRAS